MISHFSDSQQGGFYDTADDHESLLFRPKDVQDNAIPSANAMAVHVLTKLSLLTGDLQYWDIAEHAISGVSDLMARFPTGFAHWLCAASFMSSEPLEVAIIGDKDDPETISMLAFINEEYRPYLVSAQGDADSPIPLLSGRTRVNDKSTAYVCRRFVCRKPVNSTEDLAKQLK